MTSLAYLDASALVKLVIDEDGTEVVRRLVADARRHATSRLGAIETTRSCRRRAAYDAERLRAVLDRVDVVELDATVADRAATLDPTGLRTLDAIHIATALELGSEMDAFVTYDGRLADAARAAGLPVINSA